MDKTPCTDCGALILPSTAEETGGVCMACKRGIRKNIEKSKAYYRKQKDYDPHKELWRSLVDRVHKTQEGFQGLSADEKTYFAVGLLDGEVYNGGLHQFFSNSSGEYYQEVIEGLAVLGAETPRQLLCRAADILFEDAVPAKDRSERWQQMRHYPDRSDGSYPEWCVELERLDQEYCRDPDGLSDRMIEFAKAKGLVTPFGK